MGLELCHHYAHRCPEMIQYWQNMIHILIEVSWYDDMIHTIYAFSDIFRFSNSNFKITEYITETIHIVINFSVSRYISWWLYHDISRYVVYCSLLFTLVGEHDPAKSFGILSDYILQNNITFTRTPKFQCQPNKNALNSLQQLLT